VIPLQDGDRWVTVAVLGKTRGNRGELTAFSESTVERCRRLTEVLLFVPGAAEAMRRNVESVWEHGARLIFKFRGVDSISDAERLVGAEVRITFAARLEAEPGEYYRSDLIVCEALMGLFDGVPGPPGRTGSSADVAASLGWPILLVLDVSGQSQSAAANVFFTPIQDDREVSAKRHQFPYDEKDECVVDDSHNLERQDQQRKKPQVRPNGKATWLSIRASSVNAVLSKVLSHFGTGFTSDSVPPFHFENSL